MKIALAVMIAALLAACSPTAPPASQVTPQPAPPASAPSAAMIKLYESPCYFPTCITYEIEVHPDGAYTLTDRRAQNPDPVRTGNLGPEAWAKAEAAFAEAKFAEMPERLMHDTLGSKGVPCMSDLPEAEFTRRGADGSEKSVRFDTGCQAPEARKLLNDLRAALHHDELVKKN